MKSVFKYLTFFVLFTALTKTYVFWASILHVSVGVITLSLLFLTFLLVFTYTKDKILVVPKKWFRPVFIFFAVGPIIVGVLTEYLVFRVYVLQVFYFLIFLLSYLFCQKYSKNISFILFFLALFFTIISGIYSVFNPIYFLKYAIISGANEFYGGRAFGFYLQPNDYALAVNMLFIGLILLTSQIKYVFYMYPLSMIAIILAGSRSNYVGFFIMSLCMFFYLLVRSRKEIFVLFKISIPMAIIIFLAPIEYLSSKIQEDEQSALLSRIEFLFFQQSDDTYTNLSEDGSISARLHYQDVFIQKIADSPLIGYGIGIKQKFLQQKVLEGSAHNNILDVLLQGGVVYFCLFAYLIFSIIKIYFNDRRKYRENLYLLSLKIFILFMIMSLFFTTFFNKRAVFVLLGAFASSSYFNRKTTKRLSK